MIHTVNGSDADSFLQADWADLEILVGPIHVDMGMWVVQARHRDRGIVAAGAWRNLFYDCLTQLD